MLKPNQIALYSSHDLFFKDIVNKVAAQRWQRKDHVVILTATGGYQNSAGKAVGEPWYGASRATFKQRILARLNLWDWFSWEFDL